MDFQLSEEQRLWQKAVHDFVAQEVKPQAAKLSEQREMNWPAIRKMGALGMLGITVPEAYGGSDMGAVSAAIGIEELGWGDGGTALNIAAHTGWAVGPSRCLVPSSRNENFCRVRLVVMEN